MALTAPQKLRLRRDPNAGGSFSTQEELDNYIRGIDSAESQYQGPRTIQEVEAARNAWVLDHSNLGEYQSKYNTFEPVPGQPGMFRSTLQQPGKHKYDTMEAFYKLNPETGEAELVGAPKATRQQSSTKDFVKQDLPFALAAFAPVIAPQISALHGIGGALGQATTGAIIGGGIPLLTGGNTQDILGGALLGGVGGYASHELFGPMQGNGAGGVSDADFERLYGPLLTDAPLAASLPGGSAAGLGSLPTGGVQQISITGSSLPPMTGALPGAAAGVGAAYATPVQAGGPSPEDVTQIEVTGQRQQQPNLVPIVGPIGPGPMQEPAMLVRAPSAPTTTEGLANAGTTDPGPTKSATDKFLEWAKKNPIQAMQLLGGVGSLIGGSAGSGGSGGVSGAGSQAGLTAQQAPKFQRQYVAPPPGYRPGFDPEHRYFTGIGSVGAGG